MDGGDEQGTQARRGSLEPLEKWLQSGAQSPQVVIRAVQTLLADPEAPGVDQRPAVEEVRRVVQTAWATAGAQNKGMLGLQALILAAWPMKRSGWITVAPLFDSAWLAARRPERHRKHFDQWRQNVAQPPPKPAEQPLRQTTTNTQKAAIKLESGKIKALSKPFQQFIANNWSSVADSYSAPLEALSNDIKLLEEHISSLEEAVPHWQSIEHSVQEIKQLLAHQTSSTNHEQELLWWGQARYSTSLGKPYRLIEDGMERLWWMAAEASALATDVDVAPAASFLMETLRQVDSDIDTKRPIKDWLTEFFKTLRRLHASKQYADNDAMKLTPTLKQLVEKDALGLPVSWVHLQAINSTLQEADIAEHAKAAVGLDLDILIDRGEWAAWVFRESLLDWRLAGGQ
jgi:hypothetical protein